MNQHEQMNEWLPMYAAGGLDEKQRRQVAAHLNQCAECQADLELWQAVRTEIQTENSTLRAPAGLANAALAKIHSESAQRSPWQPARMWQLLKSQMGLVQKELWAASAIMIGMGFVITMDTQNINVLQTLAPLAAAAGVAALYRPEDDAARELAMSTPTSPRQVLLARLALVFGYDLILTLLASLWLTSIFPAIPFLQLILGWLAPMTFLSMLALALSLVMGHDNAILVSYSAWIFQHIPALADEKSVPLMQFPQWVVQLVDGYAHLWRQPTLLFALSAVALAAALWLVGNIEMRTPRSQESFG
jgi:hypothetical protein